MKRDEINKKAMEILKVSEDSINKNNIELGDGAIRFWNPAFGGGQVIINEAGKFLYAGSAISPANHVKAWKEGKRS